MAEKTTIWTVGHSSRSWEEFVALLREFSIALLCDIRSWPSSRKFPHFEGEAMAAALGAEGVAYEWMGRELGGHRKNGLGEASANLALRVVGFRNYADHMQSDLFRQALDTLIARASQLRTAVMCAEALYFRCHRRLLCDALVACGVRVVHILDRGKAQEHALSREARVENGVVTYPLRDDLFT